MDAVSHEIFDCTFAHYGALAAEITAPLAPGGDELADPPSTIEFMDAVFDNTDGPFYVCSFPNERGDETEPPERHVVTRDPGRITAFLDRWDKRGRGLFFCVGTVQPSARTREKATIAETIGLHADIDFKHLDSLGEDPRKYALRQLARLKHPPSAVVFSGNGLHCYWLFKEAVPTQGNIERVEAALHQLADLIAADPQCCEVARVMRLPGSHNTKDGAWKEVEVIELNDLRYELDDLEEWLSEQSPVMLRKDRPRAVTVGQADDDFFASYAKQFGIKPPIDVEQRLRGMIYMGSGDSSIHQTQIECAASMLSRGVAIGDVVAILMEATRVAAGDYGTRWNWRLEERSIRRDCEGWIKKHPDVARKIERKQKPKLKTIDGGKGSESYAADTGEHQDQQQVAADGNVVKMPAITPATPKKDELHIALGKAVLAHLQDQGEALINGPQGSWLYSQGVWTLRTDITAWLNMRGEKICHGFGYKSGVKLINETRQWIMRQPELWRDEIPWDQHGKIPTRSGLIDPVTGDLEPARPDHFCTWRVECDYDRNAACPWWETYLNDLFVGDEQVRTANIRVIQEVLGAALIDKKPRGMSKALIVQGETNTGKSGVVDVLGGMFGRGNEITTPLDALEGAHGLMPFVKRAPWVLHEAFRPGKWHLSSDVKAIVTHNPVQINVKNGPMLRAVVHAPIFWASNYVPQFKETTKAIVSRIIIIKCNRVFEEGASLVGAAKAAAEHGYAGPSDFLLATEMPGILNWAIAGLRRALERGFIELSDSIRATANEIRRDANPVAGFFEECVAFNRQRMVSIPDFCLAFSVWQEEQRGEAGRQWGNREIGKLVGSLNDPRIAIDGDLRDNKRRYYGGIMLNEAGIEYWQRGVESRLFEGKSSLATSLTDKDKVSPVIPFEWDKKPAIMAMREHYDRPRPLAPSAFDDR